MHFSRVTTLVLLASALVVSVVDCSPYRRRQRDSGPGDVRFRLKGVDRGMLEGEQFP